MWHTPTGLSLFCECYNILTYLYLLSSELRGSALSAHICPRLAQSILERIDRWCVDDILWQVVPVRDGPVTEEIFPAVQTAPLDVQLH